MKEKFDIKRDLCLCGSGKLYKDCCKNKIDISKDKKIFKQYMAEFDRCHKNYKRICMHPKKNECSEGKTHAHTISQKAVLELIAQNGLVLMPIMFGVKNEFKMEPVGIEARATKFYCFCNNHDKMFAPIDKRVDTYNEYIYFLHAYRIFASTYYKIERELGCHYKLREKYDLTSNPLALYTYLGFEKDLKLLSRYKSMFEAAIINERYNFLENINVTLNYKVGFAVATAFSPMFDLFGNEFLKKENTLSLLFISVVPNEEHTDIIFSWLKEDNDLYSFFKEQIDITPTRLFLKYLNNLLPLNCENMTVSPALWKQWGKSGQDRFIELAYNHMRSDMKLKSYSYFEEREYNLFEKY